MNTHTSHTSHTRSILKKSNAIDQKKFYLEEEQSYLEENEKIYKNIDKLPKTNGLSSLMYYSSVIISFLSLYSKMNDKKLTVKEFEKFIKACNNSNFFEIKITENDNYSYTLLHALCMGANYGYSYDFEFFGYSKITINGEFIAKIIELFEKYNDCFTMISDKFFLNLDSKNNTPALIAYTNFNNDKTKTNETLMKLLCLKFSNDQDRKVYFIGKNVVCKNGGKRKTKRFRNKKKKTQKRRN